MPTLRQLEVVCQKPNWRQTGSLLARRFARPLALYVTWVLVRWPVSANLVTGVTLAVGGAAAGLLAMHSTRAFVAGAVLLQIWYLLDHVDGQVARYRSADSVTGVYFDFMMHHLVHPACAFALGYGIALRTGTLHWSLAGAVFAMGLVIQALANDCRYKAFFSVLHRGIGAGKVPLTKVLESDSPRALTPPCGKGWGEGSSTLRTAFRVTRFLHRLGLKLCEMPNIVLAVTALAIVAILDNSSGLKARQGYVLAMAVLASALGVARLAKQVWREVPDREFASISSSINVRNRQTSCQARSSVPAQSNRIQTD